MLELTAALGSLHGLLEEEWWGGGGVRSVYSSVRGATKLHCDIDTDSDLASKEELDFTGWSNQKYVDTPSGLGLVNAPQSHSGEILKGDSGVFKPETSF